LSKTIQGVYNRETKYIKGSKGCSVEKTYQFVWV